MAPTESPHQRSERENFAESVGGSASRSQPLRGCHRPGCLPGHPTDR
jgi:hypothetical protein